MTLLTFRVILIAALAALIASPIARRIAQGFRLFDLPGSALHKQHQAPVVLAGGIAMFIAVVVTTAAVFLMERMSLAGSEVLVILAGAGLVFVVGLIDGLAAGSAGLTSAFFVFVTLDSQQAGLSLIVLSRLKHGLSVYLGRCDHTFHRLVATGVHPNRAVVTMHIAALLVGCLAFVALSLPPLAANAIFAGCVAVGVVCFLYLERAQP